MTRSRGLPCRYGVYVALALAFGGALASPAAAQSCTGLIDRFAAEHGLSEAPPAARTGDPTTEPRSRNMTDKLARSNGVIAPPETGNTPVVPPASPGDRMPTTPKLDGSRQRDEADALPRQSQSNAEASSLLDAARDAARRGDEQGCLAKLQQAQQQLSEAP